MAPGSIKETPLKELFANGLIWSAAGEDPTNQDCLPTSTAEHNKKFSSIKLGIEEIDSKLSGGGLRCGGLHDFFYSVSAAGVASPPYIFSALLAGRALKINPKEKNLIIWITNRPFPAPELLQETLADKHGSLAHCIFVSPPSPELLIWSLETALRSLAAAAVIADIPNIPLGASRRLSAAAEASGALGIILKDAWLISAPSSSLSAWQISPLPEPRPLPAWRVNLLRQKGSKFPEDSWAIEVNFKNGLSNEKGEGLSLRLLPEAPSQNLGVEQTKIIGRRFANSSF